MEKELTKYLEYLKIEKNYSDHTITSYRNSITIYRDYLEKELLDYDKVVYKDIRPFFNYLNTLKYSSSTISNITTSIRSFYKYLMLNNKIKYNPFSLVSAPKKEKKIPKFLYYNELDVLFNTPDIKTPLGIRDRLILELLYATGMRNSELVNVKIKDIDLINKQIKIMGKGSKERYVFFGDYALEYLNLYLNDARNKLIKCKTDNLLINNKGTSLEDRGLRVIINDLIEKSALDIKISPHTLRHTFATHLLDNGCDILTVEELLGHSSLKATQIYTHITDEKLKSTYLHCNPRGNEKIDD